MVSLVLQTPSVSLSDTLKDQIQFCLSELKNETSDAKFASDTKKKIKMLYQLLIQFIQQNTIRPNGDKGALLNGIAKILDSVKTEADLFVAVRQLITIIGDEPQEWSANLLQELQGLADQLKNSQ